MNKKIVSKFLIAVITYNFSSCILHLYVTKPEPIVMSVHILISIVHSEQKCTLLVQTVLVLSGNEAVGKSGNGN